MRQTVLLTFYTLFEIYHEYNTVNNNYTTFPQSSSFRMILYIRLATTLFTFEVLMNGVKDEMTGEIVGYRTSVDGVRIQDSKFQRRYEVSNELFE